MSARGTRLPTADRASLPSSPLPPARPPLRRRLRRRPRRRLSPRSLEDALFFWQREFSKAMSADDFVKKYAYNIRHNYGKEGKRADYTPYSCTRIILGAAPGPSEFHGCPYKSWDAPRLRAVLQRMRLSAPQVDAVLADVQNKDFQLACRRQASVPGARSGEGRGGGRGGSVRERGRGRGRAPRRAAPREGRVACAHTRVR